MTAAAAATQAASTKRQPDVSGGKVAAPVTNLASVSIVPLMPVSAETLNVVPLNSPRTSFETFVFADSDNDHLDIQNGDILVVSSVEYKIVHVGVWTRPNEGSYQHLVVELVKAS